MTCSQHSPIYHVKHASIILYDLFIAIACHHAMLAGAYTGCY